MPMPTIPSPPTTRPMVRCVEPPECVSGAGPVLCSSAGSSSATVTVMLAPPAGTSTDWWNGLRCGACASTTCDPGSTGIAVPHSAVPTLLPSRVTVSPSAFEETATVSRESLGSSAAARVRARSSQSVRPFTCAAATASLKVAHALAVCPFFS